MTKITKENLKAYADEIAQLHDEIKLKIHLGAKEAQDEWHEIEEKWKELYYKVPNLLDETAAI